MTSRQKQYLKHIVEMYIESGIPIASSELIKEKKLSISSATVRNDMHTLEDEGYLEKAHTSSGRVPTTKGYQYYAQNLTDDKGSEKMLKSLKDIFSKRRASIDFTITEAARVINDVTGATLVTSTSEADELMKSIQLTPIDETKATVVIVTSSGRVESKLLEITGHINMDDVRIAIRLFKERLIDTPLRELSFKLDALIPILEGSVKNYEEVIQAFVKNVFDFHNQSINKVYGDSNIIKSEDINRDDLVKLLHFIQEKSIWSSIEGEIDEDEKIRIEIKKNNTSFMSRKIKVNNISREISIVGSNRIDYSNAKIALKLLEEFFTK